MSFDSEQDLVAEEAVKFARKNKKAIARRLTDVTVYPPDEEPVSVFMAGSPGAGKTEVSIELIEFIRQEGGGNVLRIDPDELRCEFSEYDGHNSWLFQGGVSILVEKIHDLALRQRQSFCLDGTLANYAKAKDNIRRSLKKGREVQILYVYQDPMLAWDFVCKRERVEGRHVRKEDFVNQYFAARKVVNRIKGEFGADVGVDLLLKNIDGSHRHFKAGIDSIDNHVPEKYTEASLAAELGVLKR